MRVNQIALDSKLNNAVEKFHNLSNHRGNKTKKQNELYEGRTLSRYMSKVNSNFDNEK